MALESSNRHPRAGAVGTRPPSLGAVALGHFPEVAIGSVPFTITTLEDASAWFGEWAAARRGGLAVRLSNAYCVALAARDSRYRLLLASAGPNFPDGLPVVKAMARLQSPTVSQAQRVRGPSFFEQVLGSTTPLRHFFIGAAPETLELLLDTVRRRYPNAALAGSYSPPFRDLDEAYLEDIVGRIPVAEVDVVWVGLGTPKQDYVTQAIADRTALPAAGVGAAFDFLAGTVAEAPQWMRRSGLEWLFRLASEPRRLWRRYLFGNTVFLRIVLLQMLGRLVGRRSPLVR